MSKKWLTVTLLLLVMALLMGSLAGCFPSGDPVPESTAAPESTPKSSNADSGATPKLPDNVNMQNGVPYLTVYVAAEKTNEEMDIESYVEGVLAGEMRNDWPMEALKAQAILARTFVLKFISEKESKYPGADISTDISEAQAYDAAAINERIKRAVDETRGLVMVSGGEFPYAWFHAHAGGRTELAKAALEYKPAEPKYTQSVESLDSDKAPSSVKEWTVSFTADEVGKAADQTGVKVGKVTSIEIGEKGQSGRVITFKINGTNVSGPALRLQLDGKKFKSTLITDVKLEGNTVTFTGKGYGHGVGMSQWGAYGLAEQGKKADEIVEHYFKDLDIKKMWD